MKDWWDTLQPREQMILLIGGVIVLLSLVYAAVWLPLQASYDDAEMRMQASERQMQWMQNAVGQLRSSNTVQVKPDSRSLLRMVEETVALHQLKNALKQVAPIPGEQVRITFQKADFNQLIRWFATMRESGVQLNNLQLSASEQIGLVQARLVLHRAG